MRPGCISIVGNLIMQKFTYHSHNNTQGIGDGKNSRDEMLAHAEEIGFTEIGVSNHFIYHPNITRGHPQDFTDFQKALDYAKKDIEETRECAARHKIKVYAGFEVDFYPSAMWRNAFEMMLAQVKPDYVIGSTHNAFSRDESVIYSIWSMARQPVKDENLKIYLQNYWQNIIDSINSGYFNFIAHFDLASNLGVCREPEWDEWKWKVIEAFQARKTPFEINTSGIRRCGIPCPDWWMVKELVSAQVPVLISDDAHSVDMLGQFYDQAEARLAEFGCRNRFKF